MAETTPLSNSDASSFLSALLNKTLRVHTTDKRMFVGHMKCTDREQNIILGLTHEYRHPSAVAIQAAARAHEEAKLEGNVKVDMLKRFVGLVVVPGQYITKIEVDG